jgi:hypothetical protein
VGAEDDWHGGSCATSARKMLTPARTFAWDLDEDLPGGGRSWGGGGAWGDGLGGSPDRLGGRGRGRAGRQPGLLPLPSAGIPWPSPLRPSLAVIGGGGGRRGRCPSAVLEEAETTPQQDHDHDHDQTQDQTHRHYPDPDPDPRQKRDGDKDGNGERAGPPPERWEEVPLKGWRSPQFRGTRRRRRYSPGAHWSLRRNSPGAITYAPLGNDLGRSSPGGFLGAASHARVGGSPFPALPANLWRGGGGEVPHPSSLSPARLVPVRLGSPGRFPSPGSAVASLPSGRGDIFRPRGGA